MGEVDESFNFFSKLNLILPVITLIIGSYLGYIMKIEKQRKYLYKKIVLLSEQGNEYLEAANFLFSQNKNKEYPFVLIHLIHEGTEKILKGYYRLIYLVDKGEQISDDCLKTEFSHNLKSVLCKIDGKYIPEFSEVTNDFLSLKIVEIRYLNNLFADVEYEKLINNLTDVIHFGLELYKKYNLLYEKNKFIVSKNYKI